MAGWWSSQGPKVNGFPISTHLNDRMVVLRGWNNQHIHFVQLGCQISDAKCAKCQALFSSDANSRMPNVPNVQALFSSDANSRMPASDAKNTLSRSVPMTRMPMTSSGANVRLGCQCPARVPMSSLSASVQFRCQCRTQVPVCQCANRVLMSNSK